MKKGIINILLVLSLLHLLIMVYYSLTSEHAYVVANFPEPLGVIMLIYAPVIITLSIITLFMLDLVIKKEKNWRLFFIAFIVNLSETIFVIGSLFFGGH